MCYSACSFCSTQHLLHTCMPASDSIRRCCTRCPFCLPQVVHAASDEVLVTGGYDQCVKVWDCRSRSPDAIQTMRHFKVRIYEVASKTRAWQASGENQPLYPLGTIVLQPSAPAAASCLSYRHVARSRVSALHACTCSLSNVGTFVCSALTHASMPAGY